MEKAASTLNRKKPSFPQELITLLMNYHFPGNVRELELIVFDAVARCRGGIIGMESFREAIGEKRSLARVTSAKTLREKAVWDLRSDTLPTLKEAEEFLIAETLRRSNGNQGVAASLLGITRQALNKRLSRERKK
jgi:DNA-binding NtrC family response regulator